MNENRLARAGIGLYVPIYSPMNFIHKRTKPNKSLTASTRRYWANLKEDWMEHMWVSPIAQIRPFLYMRHAIYVIHAIQSSLNLQII